MLCVTIKLRVPHRLRWRIFWSPWSLDLSSLLWTWRTLLPRRVGIIKQIKILQLQREFSATVLCHWVAHCWPWDRRSLGRRGSKVHLEEGLGLYKAGLLPVRVGLGLNLLFMFTCYCAFFLALFKTSNLQNWGGMWRLPPHGYIQERAVSLPGLVVQRAVWPSPSEGQ